MRSIRQAAIERTVSSALAVASRGSDEDLLRMLSLVEFLAGTTGSATNVKPLLGSIRRLWQSDRPLARLLKRFLHEANPRCRERFLANFVLSYAWGPVVSRRRAFAQQEGVSPPYTCVISPTMRCNLSCLGCFANDYSREDELPAAVVDRVVGEAEEFGVFLITILGGEPFLRPDMWDIYERHHDVTFLVFTNGTLLDQDAVRRLARLGNVLPALSIEGFEETTDARRGQGTYAQVVAAMDRLHAAGVPFGFSTMVTGQNIDAVVSDEFNDMLLAHGAFFGWHFLYLPIGSNPDASLMPTPEQRDRLRREGASRIRATRPLFVADFWHDAPHVGGCIAGGRKYLHINARGDVEPCAFAHFAVDNIKDKSLREVLRSPFFRAIRSRQPFGGNLLRPCMLIDHPEVLREAVAVAHAYPTHPSAATMLTTLAGGLDSYAGAVAEVLDEAWQNEYVNAGFVSAIHSVDSIEPTDARPAPGRPNVPG